MARIPTEKQIPVKIKPGDFYYQNQQNQLIRMSFSDLTDKGYIDIAVLNQDNKKDLQGAKVRIYISNEDNVDQIFGLSGPGVKKESKPVIYLEGENIKLVSDKGKIEQALLGNSTVKFIIKVLDLFGKHKHPLESPPVEFLQQIEQLKKEAQELLSKGVFIS